MSKITDILPSLDKKGRYDIYADGEQVLTLSEDAIVECSLKVGDILDTNRLCEIEEKLELVRTRAKAYNLLSYGDMSKKTLFTKLSRSGYGEDAINKCICILEEQGYLDDERYANRLCAYLASTKLFGKRRILLELIQKGIDRQLAELVTEEQDADYYQNLLTLISKERITDEKSITRLKNKLVRYGYDYDMISSALGSGEYYD